MLISLSVAMHTFLQSSHMKLREMRLASEAEISRIRNHKDLPPAESQVTNTSEKPSFALAVFRLVRSKVPEHWPYSRGEIVKGRALI